MSGKQHCQICGKAYKLNKKGLISNHGYKSGTGGGHNAHACPDSECRPIEVTTAAIPFVIARYQKQIVKSRSEVEAMIATPPRLFDVNTYSLLTPGDFVYSADPVSPGREMPYGKLFYAALAYNDAEVVHLAAEIARLEIRLIETTQKG